MDAHANFAYSTVATAPSPATSGTSMVLQSGDGAKFPAAPFNVTIWPANSQPTTLNAEIVRVTAKVTDTLTIVRAQEGSTARTVIVGDQIAATITKKTLTDIEALQTVTSTITTTGTQAALAIPAGTGDLVIFANNATLLTVQGITAGLDGQQLSIFSIGAGEVDFPHENASASAALRLHNFATSGLTPLAPGVGIATFVYDANFASGPVGRWVLKEHVQGAFITRAFSAGNYTASGTLTWTVAAAITDRYYLDGRKLTMQQLISGSTGGLAAAELRVALPNGYTAASRAGQFSQTFDGTTGRAGMAESQTGSPQNAYLRVFIDQSGGVTNWPAGATGQVEFTHEIEVN